MSWCEELTNLIKGVHAHLDVVGLNARVVRLDTDFDRVVNNTFDAHHHLQGR